MKKVMHVIIADPECRLEPALFDKRITEFVKENKDRRPQVISSTHRDVAIVVLDMPDEEEFIQEGEQRLKRIRAN